MPRRPTRQIDVLGQAEEHVISSLLLISTAFIVKAIKAALSAHTSLNATRFCVLLALLRNRRCLQANQLAEELAVSSSTISLAASKLEACGFISRKATDGDRRASELQMTTAGKQAITHADAVVAEALDAIWQPLSANQRTAMLKSALRATRNSRRERIEGGLLRADTAYVEGTLIGYNAFVAACELHGLNYFETTALAWLHEHDSPVNKSRLAAALLIKANYLSQICDALRKRGLIAEDTGSDRRVLQVSITSAGSERICRTMTSLDEVVRHGIYQSSAEEQATFRDVAKIIVANEIEHRRHGLQA